MNKHSFSANKCYLCGNKLKKENIDIARYWGKELIALSDVPALICTQCGEKYFEADISAKIDERIKAARETKGIARIDVPLVQF